MHHEMTNVFNLSHYYSYGGRLEWRFFWRGTSCITTSRLVFEALDSHKKMQLLYMPKWYFQCFIVLKIYSNIDRHLSMADLLVIVYVFVIFISVA